MKVPWADIYGLCLFTKHLEEGLFVLPTVRDGKVAIPFVARHASQYPIRVTGNSYDNALVESINGLYKEEVIHRMSWKKHAKVELATLAWVGWSNNRRLLEGPNHIPPVKTENTYYVSSANNVLAA